MPVQLIVNPTTLKRVEKLFCKNERALIRTRLAGSLYPVTLVPVVAILVAGIRLRFLEMPVNRNGTGRRTFARSTGFRKSEEMGGSSTAPPSSCLPRTASASVMA